MQQKKQKIFDNASGLVDKKYCASRIQDDKLQYVHPMYIYICLEEIDLEIDINETDQRLEQSISSQLSIDENTPGSSPNSGH